jgi:hypothetical protein
MATLTVLSDVIVVCYAYDDRSVIIVVVILISLNHRAHHCVLFTLYASRRSSHFLCQYGLVIVSFFAIARIVTKSKLCYLLKSKT